MKLKRPKKGNKTKQELDVLYSTIKGMDPASPDYSAILDQIGKLEDIYAKQKNRPSADGILSVVGSLASLVLVLNAEEIGHKILTSKALGFIKRIK